MSANPMEILKRSKAPTPPPTPPPPAGGGGGSGSIEGMLQSIGVKMGQAALIVGGVGFGFILPTIFRKRNHPMLNDLLFLGGIAMLVTGIGWTVWDNWGKVKFQSPIAAANATYLELPQYSHYYYNY